jgi:hypothetical protein
VINPKELLRRMLLVFLILPINMVFVILIQLLHGKGEEFFNWNSKYQHEDVSLKYKMGYTYASKLGMGFWQTQEVKTFSR